MFKHAFHNYYVYTFVHFNFVVYKKLSTLQNIFNTEIFPTYDILMYIKISDNRDSKT